MKNNIFKISITKVSFFQKLFVGVIIILMLNSIISFVGVLNVIEMEKTAKIMINKSKQINELQTLKSNFLYLLNPANDFLIHGNKIEIVNYNRYDSILKKQIKKLISNKVLNINKSFISSIERSLIDMEFLVNEIFKIKKPVGNLEGIVIMEDADAITNKIVNDLDNLLIVETNEMTQYLNRNQATKIKTTKIIIVLGFFLVLVLVIGGFFYVREITMPIKHLKQMAQKIALGDLSIKADVKTSVQDEIDDFSISFNNMVGTLQQTTVSRVFFSNIINRMAVSLIITDNLGKIKIVNKATLNLLGYCESKILGKPFSKIINKSKTKENLTDFDLSNNLEDENGKNIYKTYYTKSKKAITVLFSKSIIYDKNKNIKGVLYIAHHKLTNKKSFTNPFKDISESVSKEFKTIGIINLTRREKEIVKLITSELSNQEIADKLFISIRTVETHRKNIMQKLHTKNVISLVHYAAQNELI